MVRKNWVTERAIRAYNNERIREWRYIRHEGARRIQRAMRARRQWRQIQYNIDHIADHTYAPGERYNQGLWWK